jgi:hypothetical protein
VRQKYRTLDRKFLYGCISLYAEALSCSSTGEEVPWVSSLTNAIIYVKSFSMPGLISGTACYHSMQNRSFSSLLSKNILTYLILTPWSRVLPEKLTGS